MTQSIKGLFVIMLLFTLLASCRYDVKEEIINLPGECLTESRSYIADIVPIIEMNCYVCHAANVNLGGITLEGYDATKSFVDNGLLLGAIRRENGFSPMPQDAEMLPACEISNIEAWIDQGALDN